MRLDRAALGRLRERLQRETDAGLAFGGVEGATAAIGYRGEVVWSEGFGAATGQTPILALSVTKTVVESALWVLFGRGALSPETPVVEIVPEFLGGTRPEITVGMIETHVSGFAFAPLDFPEARERSARLSAFSSWRVDRDPGYYEYHPVSGGWVLAEIIDRVSGVDYRDFLRSEVLEPLRLWSPAGMRLGAEEDELEDVLLHRNYANGYTPDPALYQPMAYGLDTIPGLALGTPGVGAVATAGGIARLYQSYLGDPLSLWAPEVLDDARSRVRVRQPDTFGRPMLRSLSFVLAGQREERYGERTFFGPQVSPRAFGHQGQGGQIAWADPESGLSFAFLTNTVVFPPGGTFHGRSRELSALAADLVS